MVINSTDEVPFILRIILEPLLPKEWDENEHKIIIERYLNDLQTQTDLYNNTIEVKNVLVRGRSPIMRLKVVITLEYHSLDIAEPKKFIDKQLPFIINHTMNCFETCNLPMEVIVDKNTRYGFPMG